MKSFHSLLQSRRSIRAYENAPVERETVDALIRAALLSPSSKGLQPWHFVVVEEKEMLEQLAGCKPHGADFLAGAPLGIAVTADTEEAAAWIEDASIASVILQMEAEELGLGSCWIQIRGRSAPDGGSASDYVRRVLKIPAGIEVEAIIAIGYPAETKDAHSLEALPYDRIHYGRFGGNR